MKKIRPLFTAAVFSMAFAAPLCVTPIQLVAQDKAVSADAEAIYNKYVEAVGGKKAIQGVKSIVNTGDVTIVQQGIKGTMKSVEVRPGRSATIMEIPQIGKNVQVLDGDVGWSTSMMGTQKMKPEQIAQMKLQLELSSGGDFSKIFTESSVKADEEFNGATCARVEAKTEAGDEMTMFFDKSSNLMVGMKTVAKTQMGNMPMTIKMLDYKKVGPLTLSHKTVIEQGPMTIEIVTSEVEIDGEIPEDMFKRPDGI